MSTDLIRQQVFVRQRRQLFFQKSNGAFAFFASRTRDRSASIDGSRTLTTGVRAAATVLSGRRGLLPQLSRTIPQRNVISSIAPIEQRTTDEDQPDIRAFFRHRLALRR